MAIAVWSYNAYTRNKPKPGGTESPCQLWCPHLQGQRRVDVQKEKHKRKILPVWKLCCGCACLPQHPHCSCSQRKADCLVGLEVPHVMSKGEDSFPFQTVFIMTSKDTPVYKITARDLVNAAANCKMGWVHLSICPQLWK